MVRPPDNDASISAAEVTFIAQGHSHVVIEAIDSLTSTTVTTPTSFAFFKGLNTAAVNGVLTATVTGGLPAGTYRVRLSPLFISRHREAELEILLRCHLSTLQATTSRSSSLSPRYSQLFSLSIEIADLVLSAWLPRRSSLLCKNFTSIRNQMDSPRLCPTKTVSASGGASSG